MTQTMNNQILLKTLAFCAVVAGIGAVPAVATPMPGYTDADMYRDISNSMREQRERFDRYRQENQVMRLRQEMESMRNEMESIRLQREMDSF